MEFWSKGLGKLTIQLSLAKGQALMSGDTLYVRGRMEEPVSWEYILVLRSDDLIDFFGLLRDPSFAEFVYESPDRWRTYVRLVAGGVQLLGHLVRMSVQLALAGTEREEVPVQVPPPRERRGASRRRLGSRVGVSSRSASPRREMAAGESASSTEATSQQ